MSLHLKINCGGDKIEDYLADTCFSAGASFPLDLYPDIDASNISNPAPLDVYDTIRYHAAYFKYAFTALDDTKDYRVRIHFAETNPARRQRVFVNGVEISPGGSGGMDIFALAGPNTVFCLTAEVSGESAFDVEFYSVAVNAAAAAIEVIEIVTPEILLPFNALELIPAHFYEDVPDFEKITNKHVYEDEGVDFNTTNDYAPRKWIYEFTGLTKSEAAVFDDHFLRAKFHKDFGFTDRNGYKYDGGIYYAEYPKPPHDLNKRFNQNRRIVLVQYP